MAGVGMIELEIVREDKPYQVLRIGQGVFVIGRQEGVQIHLDDKEVSRKHARLIIDGDVMVVEDMESGNGTFVAGVSVRQQVLSMGDVVEIMPFKIRLRAPVQRLHELAPAPLPPEPKHWLEIVDGPGTGQRYALKGEAMGIGRHEDQDIRLPDQGASRSHAMMVRRGDTWQVRDLGSVNGVMVGNERVGERMLEKGDELRVGNTTLRYDNDLPSMRMPKPAQARPAQGGTTPEWLVPLVLLLALATVFAAFAVGMNRP
jgi:pSer/pThr/pTyr-binding forkhead associated (FHA) protein